MDPPRGPPDGRRASSGSSQPRASEVVHAFLVLFLIRVASSCLVSPLAGALTGCRAHDSGRSGASSALCGVVARESAVPLRMLRSRAPRPF